MVHVPTQVVPRFVRLPSPADQHAFMLLEGVIRLNHRASLRERRMGSAVRLQHDGTLPTDVLTILVDELEVGADDLYPSEGFIAFADLFQLYASADLPRRKDCACRKPKPALFLELAGTYGIDLAASTHVGDSVKDRDAAAAAGIGTFAWPREFFGWPE